MKTQKIIKRKIFPMFFTKSQVKKIIKIAL